tara:strand:- start:208 stop:783 length:576 start_codon:yes stop_codon:yes gene_type:complete
MISGRGYQRTHLRAPYKEPVLFVDDNFVFKASTLNISEGGLLLDQIPHFPEDEDEVPILVSLPQFPYFKNFSLEKLQNFSSDIFPKKIVRVKAQMVRRIGLESTMDEVFVSKVGLKFTDVSPQAQKQISDYVNVFASNLIHLQMLIDSIHASEKNLTKVRALSEILNYDLNIKVAQLYKEVQHDYRSLQWL